MPLYYVQVVYQKNQLGTRLDKDRDDPRSKLYQRKASVVSVNGIGGSGVVLSPSVGVLGGRAL